MKINKDLPTCKVVSSNSPVVGLPKNTVPCTSVKKKKGPDPGKVLMESLVKVQVHRSESAEVKIEEKPHVHDSKKVENVQTNPVPAVSGTVPARVLTFEEKLKSDIERYNRLYTEELQNRLDAIDEKVEGSIPVTLKTFWK
jgi:hypothetical protein